MPNPSSVERTTSINSAWDCLKDWDRTFPATGRHMVLPSSAELMFVDFSNLAPMRHKCLLGRSPLVFSFWLAGNGWGYFHHTACGPRTIAVRAGKAGVFYAPGSSLESEMPGRQRCRNFSIYVAPDWLLRIFGEAQGVIPRPLHAALENGGREPYLLLADMTDQVRLILNQIYACPYQGVDRQLFLENKCIELIMRQLYDMAHNEYPRHAAKLPSGDIERIHEARRILTGNLDNPPTLHQLGRQVGINTNKLNRGFRQAYGTTVHALLRRERLARARLLLEEDRLSITEIGHQLGFSDASHFVREFSRQFGTTPGRFARTFRH